MKLESADLKPLGKLIDDLYLGNPLDMKDDIYMIIYMLHFLPRDCVAKEDIEKAVLTLKTMTDSLQEIHEGVQL